jgi:hypothetical protein
MIIKVRICALKTCDCKIITNGDAVSNSEKGFDNKGISSRENLPNQTTLRMRNSLLPLHFRYLFLQVRKILLGGEDDEPVHAAGRRYRENSPIRELMADERFA